MNGRLSNSELLRQIIPQTMNTKLEVKPKSFCSTRTIKPAELILRTLNKRPLTTIKIKSKLKVEVDTTLKERDALDLLCKIQQLKDAAEFDNIVKGSKLGLKAYQKPKDGIPISDLSVTILNFILLTLEYMSRPEKVSHAFGKVLFDKDTKKLNFYSEDDANMNVVLGSVDLTDLQVSIVADTKINASSTNAVANSAVAKSLQIIKNMIPIITVSQEILKIEQ